MGGFLHQFRTIGKML